jgi:hypothetical protein
MFDTFSILTLHLATAYGVGIVIVALAALTGAARLAAVLADFERSPGLSFIAALFAIVLGLVLVMLHNLWTDPAAVVVTLLGWLVLFKGALILAAPEGLMKFASAASASAGTVRAWGLVALVLAAVYLFIGLAGRASVSL